MDTKFTKAPWFHNGDDCDWSLWYQNNDGMDESILCATYLGNIDVQNEADMNLIAAAPKMYALLDKLLNAGSWYSSALEIDTYEGYDGEELKKMIETVLAEARGESNEVDKIR